MRQSCRWGGGNANTAGGSSGDLSGGDSAPAGRKKDDAGVAPEDGNKRGNFILMVSYSRTALGQKVFSGGHVACLGGYDRETDEALILEVNSWRYPSVWASCSLLHKGSWTKTKV